MVVAEERSSLHVEGDDDFNSIIHLLIRNGINYDKTPWPRLFPKVEKIGGVEKILDGIETAVSVSSGRSIGFVLDADTPLASRWQAVRDRLKRVEVKSPTEPPQSGFIGVSDKFKSRVGVWLMPDNQHDGKLEHFLQTLIDENDNLIGHAQVSSAAAREVHGAKFSETDLIKAVIHAWLAWQEEPGKPYGTAIRSRYFRRHDSQAAQTFVQWFRDLYHL